MFPVCCGSLLRISALKSLPLKILSTAWATFLITFHSCRFPGVSSMIVSNMGKPDLCCVTFEKLDLFFACSSFAVLSPTVAFSTPPINPLSVVFFTKQVTTRMLIEISFSKGKIFPDQYTTRYYFILIPKPRRLPWADAMQRTPLSFTV